MKKLMALTVSALALSCFTAGAAPPHVVAPQKADSSKVVAPNQIAQVAVFAIEGRESVFALSMQSGGTPIDVGLVVAHQAPLVESVCVGSASNAATSAAERFTSHVGGVPDFVSSTIV